MYEITLATVGNPDFGQYAPISPKQTIHARTYAEIQKKVRRYIDDWDVGGGNWLHPVLTYKGEIIGRVSYNGRVWKLAADRVEVTDFPE